MTGLLPVRSAGGHLALSAGLAATLAASLPSVAVATPRQRTVVEALVAAANPCAALRTEIGGQAIGLDELDDVEIRTADAALDGDALKLSLRGRLSCRAPAGAALQGDAASDIDATAALSLADCKTAEVRVSLGNFGGSLASLVEALRPSIEAELADAARPPLVAACRELRGG